MLNNHTNSDLLDKWLKNNTFYNKCLLNDEEAILQAGNNRALRLFQEASVKIPAYKDFLKKNGIKPVLINTLDDYKKVTPTTKENYIEKYDFKDRCWDGDISGVGIISTSSGTTGKVNFWPRNLSNEIDGALAHEFIFRDILQIQSKKTLFINGFAMGNWIAGTFTSAAVSLCSWKGIPITLMSPGYSLEAVLVLLIEIAPRFEVVILSGHAPFLKEVIKTAIDQKINLTRMDIRLLGTGQAITENWRWYLLKLLGSKDYYHTIINLYGSADAALMGFETSLSIFVRRVLSDDIKSTQKLFGLGRLPSLCNYDPRLTFFEEENGELIITKDSVCPLIRYNIHDNGGVISASKMQRYLSENKKRQLKASKFNFPDYKLPFVYVFGREKFMVKIFGANVYSEHVQQALNHNSLQPLITGRYVLEMSSSEDHDSVMICRIELNQGVEATSSISDLIQKMFVEGVRKINSEYDFVLSKLGDKVKPKILLHENGHPTYFPKDKVRKNA